MKLAIVLGAAALFGARTAAAQDVRGTVRDSVTHQPISGAVVTLLDSARAVIIRRITDEGGEFTIASTRAPRFARVVRIGFLPRDVQLPHAAGAAISMNVAMLRAATMLTAINVRDQSHCSKRSDRAAALGLWEQARAGLLATIVARETNTASVYRLGFDRTFDGASDKITRFVVRADSATSASKSFTASMSAKDFVATGFIHDSAGDQLLYGPDADVLIDDAFASGYCFRLAGKAKSRPTQVGLSFSPAELDRQRKRIDIDGTLWVDTAARAIVDIEYRYVGMPYAADEYHPGGEVSFHQMPNGAVMIDRWYVRGVGARLDTITDVAGMRERKWLFASETGGELAHAAWPNGSTWQASLGSLHVRAVTTDGTPARGAKIVLPGTPYEGTADANGDIRIGDLEPGPYTVSLASPPLSDIGLAIPTPLKFIAVRDSTYVGMIKVLTAANWVSDRCIADRQWDVRDSVFVVGRVLTAGGEPVGGVKMQFFFQTKEGLWALLPDFYTTGTDGEFQSCSYTYMPGGTMRVTATLPGREPVSTLVPLLPKLNTVLIHLPEAP